MSDLAPTLMHKKWLNFCYLIWIKIKLTKKWLNRDIKQPEKGNGIDGSVLCLGNGFGTKSRRTEQQ
ncbi:hypothetical protein HanIR_Chr16g0794171 [Helianthus annuus]|nr:hypothetical protein HanIR_Chr16g0794171 [Helianthus annuus]